MDHSAQGNAAASQRLQASPHQPVPTQHQQQAEDGSYYLPPLDHPRHGLAPHGRPHQHQPGTDSHAQPHDDDNDVDAMFNSALAAYNVQPAQQPPEHSSTTGGDPTQGHGATSADHLALVRAATLGQHDANEVQQQAPGGAQHEHGHGAEDDGLFLPDLPLPPGGLAQVHPAPAPAAEPSSPPPAAGAATAGPADSASAPSRPGRGPGSRARWTAAEDAHLVHLVRVVPPLTWSEIGESMSRPPTGCSMRWYKFLRDKVAKGEMDGGTAQPPSNTDSAAPATNGTDANGAHTSGELQPSSEMVVGGSGAVAAHAQAPVQNGATNDLAHQGQGNSDTAASASPSEGAPSFVKRTVRKAVATSSTGRVASVAAIPPSALPPALPPSETLPGHPYPLKEGTKLHSNAGRGYLPVDAMVANPPVPFQPHTVLRGRRTQAPAPRPSPGAAAAAAASASPAAAAAAAGSASPDGLPVMPPDGSPAPPSQSQAQPQPPKKGKGSKGGLSKAGESVHVCPAEHCTAAFKRSEHLRRHYKSVHRGEKPFPCTVAGCGKTFSRKDNLQQHQAMVHLVRAKYTYPDGSVSNDPPEVGTPAAEGVTITFEEVDVTRAPKAATSKAGKGSKEGAAGGGGGAGGGARAKKGETTPAVVAHAQAQQAQAQGQGQGLRAVVPGAANYSVAPSVSPPGAEGGAESGREGSASAAPGRPKRRRSATGDGADGATLEDADADAAARNDSERIDKRLRLTGVAGQDDDALDPALQVLAAQAQTQAAQDAGGATGTATGTAAGGRSITPSAAAFGGHPAAQGGASAAAAAAAAASASQVEAQQEYYARLAQQLQLARRAGDATEGDVLVDDVGVGGPGLAGLYVPGLEAFLNGQLDGAHGGGGGGAAVGQQGEGH